MQRLPLTSKRLVELNPVFKDKVAIVFSMPEPGFPKQLSNTSLQATDGSFICPRQTKQKHAPKSWSSITHSSERLTAMEQHWWFLPVPSSWSWFLPSPPVAFKGYLLVILLPYFSIFYTIRRGYIHRSLLWKWKADAEFYLGLHHPVTICLSPVQ